MRSSGTIVALGLMAAGVPQAAQACAMYRPLDPRDVREAEVVVVGRLSGYRTVLDHEQRRRNREMLARNPALRDIVGGEPKGLLGDYVVFDVTVEDALVGQSPRRIRVTWDNSTFGEPERMPDGRYLMALRRAGPDTRSEADFTVFQYACSGAFLFPSGSPEALAALRVLAGKEPYSPDPPAPPPSPAPDPSVATPAAETPYWQRTPPPAPASEASYGDISSPPSLWERIPSPYGIVLGLAGLGLLAAFGGAGLAPQAQAAGRRGYAARRLTYWRTNAILRAPPAQARTPSTCPSAPRVNTKVVTPRRGVENPSAKRGVSGHSTAKA